MLNINEVDIDTVSTISLSNETLKIKVRLKSDPDVVCPLCKGPVIKNGFISKKLTHSTLVIRKCFIIYERYRYLYNLHYQNIIYSFYHHLLYMHNNMMIKYF